MRTPLHLSKFFLLIINLILSFQIAGQNVPKPANISSMIESSRRSALEVQKAKLVNQLDDLTKLAKSNSEYCANFEVGSQRQADCIQRAAVFRQRVQTYTNAVKALNDKVRIANRTAVVALPPFSGRGLVLRKLPTGKGVKLWAAGKQVTGQRASGLTYVNRIKAGKDPITIRFSESHTLTIEPFTEVELDRDKFEESRPLAEKLRILLTQIKGNGAVVIRRVLRGSDRFKVRTPKAVLAVRGTKFRISALSGEYSYTLIEGSIEVIDPVTGNVVVPDEGETVSLPSPVSVRQRAQCSRVVQREQCELLLVSPQ